jgi:hypothetical protein
MYCYSGDALVFCSPALGVLWLYTNSTNESVHPASRAAKER